MTESHPFNRVLNEGLHIALRGALNDLAVADLDGVAPGVPLWTLSRAQLAAVSEAEEGPDGVWVVSETCEPGWLHIADRVRDCVAAMPDLDLMTDPDMVAGARHYLRRRFFLDGLERLANTHRPE